jgi:hypothetical protein
MLPDDVLLEIFDFLLRENRRIEEWMTLAHVCQRWRSVIFQSPLRLNLQLLCTPTTRARDLNIWPPLPLIIDDYSIFSDEIGVDNIMAALDHTDRVCQITLKYFSNPKLEYVVNSAAMQKTYPDLTNLELSVYDDESRPMIPDSFLGGTAPRLRSLQLFNVPFLGLPKLLLSTTHLVDLDLYIPRFGYIPPETMATSLFALTNLEFLRLKFRYPRPRPSLESRRPPPLTRSILPSLTKVEFEGVSEYLEEILARIDVPRLNELDITFFNQIIFDTPQLFQFISRRPTLRALEKGHITFDSAAVSVRFSSETSDYGVLNVRILCTASEWQLSSLEQVCTSSLPPVSTLEDLYIVEGGYRPPRWQDDVENTVWLDLLRSFVAVKNLYLWDKFRIAPALQELVEERTTEVLPTLENIFLRRSQSSGPIHEGVERFIASRRLTNHPVAVSRWGEYRTIYNR